MDWVIFRRIKNSDRLAIGRVSRFAHLQALIVHNFNDWPDPFATELWSGDPGKRSFPEK